MNRTKIYSCLVRRSFREFPCKFLGHTVSPFWRSRSFVVWKRVAHHEKSCDQNRYSVEQENQARSAKFEKKGILMSFFNIILSVVLHMKNTPI